MILFYRIERNAFIWSGNAPKEIAFIHQEMPQCIMSSKKVCDQDPRDQSAKQFFITVVSGQNNDSKIFQKPDQNHLTKNICSNCERGNFLDRPGANCEEVWEAKLTSIYFEVLDMDCGETLEGSTDALELDGVEEVKSA
ncbi:hypothetical protein FXO38_06447 [Capsicum annuum]|nr:hypothetical protein FXO38_06447 [Capsicum annuum]KAF3678262.1 hypothetical protein FXO37_04462 [Capsicum annuum]